MKTKLKLFSTFFISFVFSITSKLSNSNDPPFLSPSKFLPNQLQIDYIIDKSSDFDLSSTIFLTDLLESTIQVAFYILQDTSISLSPSPSSPTLCPEFSQFSSSQIPPSDIILLISSTKNSHSSLTFQDCSSSLYPQKLVLIKVNLPLLLQENEKSSIYSLIQFISTTYFKNSEILEKIDNLFNKNLGISCTATCKVCNTNTGSCVTCYDPTHMAIKNGICYCTDPNAVFFSPTSSCVCKNGYFSNSTSLCTSCPSICATCSSLTSCTSCISPSQMTIYNNWCYCSSPEGSVFNSTSLLCNCPNGTWNNQEFCQNCNATCSTCSSENICTACADAENMSLIGGVCSCKVPNTVFNETLGLCECEAGFYINNSACEPCKASCESCSNETFCDTCADPSHMSLNNGQCTCNIGDTYFNETTKLCTCLEGAYLNDSMCEQCKPPCRFCSSITFCESCSDSRMTLNDGICTCPQNFTFIPIAGVCECNTGFYYNISTKGCVSCLPPCATCGSVSFCQSCVDSNHMALSDGTCTCIDKSAIFNYTSLMCVCPNGYFMGNSGYCQQCSTGCNICDSLENCISCKQGLLPAALVDGYCTCTTPNTQISQSQGCVCSSGYYFIQEDPQCAKCPSPCNSCLISDLNSMWCESCIDPIMFVNNGICYCPGNTTFSQQLNLCECNDGYYLMGYNCNPCSLPCKTCQNFANSCTSCIFPNQMVLNGANCDCTTPTNSYYNHILNQCTCPEMTYLNNTSCDKCHQTCMTCENTTACLTCFDPHMTLSNNGLCVCPENSYYSDDFCYCANNYYWNNSECTQCPPPCLICESETFCTQCYDSSNMNLVNGLCTCIDPNADFDIAGKYCACNSGYFMYNSRCMPCQITCGSCYNNLYCTSCIDQIRMERVDSVCSCIDPNASFNSSQKTCVCNIGYQLSGNICIACPVQCSFCSSNNYCEVCSNAYEMAVKNGDCVCVLANTVYDPISNSCICKQKYYFYDNLCYPCQSPMCLECEINRCSSCIDSVNMYLDSGICYCKDPNSYFNASSEDCQCIEGYQSNLIGNFLECLQLTGPCIQLSADGTCLECISTSNSKMWIHKDECYCATPNMNYNKTLKDCYCNSGYYFNGMDMLCHPCGTISGCIECNLNICVQCQSGMTKNANSCTCNDGLYWNSTLNTCVCTEIYNYYSINACVACNCPVCSITGECLEACPQNSGWSLSENSCVCENGYYDCGNQCCTLSKTCTVLENNVCQHCITTMILDNNNNCQCESGFIYDPELNYCVCQTGYYNSCVGCQCQACGNNCNECTNSTQCTSCIPTFQNVDGNCKCDPNAYNDENVCICQNGFFMSENLCYNCLAPCETCTSILNCSTCLDGLEFINSTCICPDLNAVYNTVTEQCECAIGFYNESSSCVSCLGACYGCLEDGVTCTSCPDAFNMILNNGVCSCIDHNAVLNSTTMKCECPYGYYNNLNACNACGPSCSQCANNQCMGCYDSENMVLTGNSCNCLDPNSEFLEWAKICACKAGFYFSGQVCLPFPGLMFNKKIE